MAAMRISNLKHFTCPFATDGSRDSKNELKVVPNGTASLHIDATFSKRLLGVSGFQRSVFVAGTSSTLLDHRFFSSTPRGINSTADLSASVTTASNSEISQSTDEPLWLETLTYFRDVIVPVWCIVIGTLFACSLLPGILSHVQQWLDTLPYLRDVIVPVVGLLTLPFLKWTGILGRILRRLRYSSQDPLFSQGTDALLQGSSVWRHVLDEKSFYRALETPVRYLVILMVVKVVLPSAVGTFSVLTVCFLSFLSRWKTNVVGRALAAKNIERGYRIQCGHIYKLLAVDQLASMGLFAICCKLAVVEFGAICWMAIIEIAYMSWMGYYVREDILFPQVDIVLGEVPIALFAQFPQPFSIRRTIKAGSVEVPRLHELCGPETGKERENSRQEADENDRNHVLSERKRREKMNERFLILGSLIPSGGKVDKVSILDHTIEHLKELERRAEELESYKEAMKLESMNRSKPQDAIERTSDNYGPDKTSHHKKSSAKKRKVCETDTIGGEKNRIHLRDSSTDDVGVEVTDKDVSIEISCSWKESLVIGITGTVRSLRMDILTMECSNIDGILSMTIKAQCKGMKTPSANVIRQALQMVISQELKKKRGSVKI